MAAPIAGRSTVVVCTLFRATTTNPTASASRPSSSPLSSIRSAFRPLQSRVSSPPSRLVRRELASLRPIHTAIASACLVSKLPADPTIYIEVSMKNYDYNPCLCDRAQIQIEIFARNLDIPQP
ncbi:hypothetical protein FEM48_Zijuj07G0026600 [Ziziphus jujuba var. spinosa]|uniref:Uncharacterized protein n=1 Tax=Ziziphus jujuba var. spinosa TaxID=714518 RepID=A0A978V1Z3_ZIZJJ|nr:hypothetical protein FEM48_Zijuj07G0026600 [Ziziphus jujuba var. spinosa]